MNIAVDLDDTILNNITNLILFFNSVYGRNLKKEQFFSCLYRQVWGGTKEEEQEILRNFCESKYFSEILPIKGSQRMMNVLKKNGHNLVVVTGRVYSLTKKTEDWVGKFFPNVFSDIYHTNSYGESGLRIKKSDMCKKLNMDLIIDDDFNHVVDCTNADIPVLVYSTPWNQNEFPKKALRLNEWNDEALELISKLMKA